MNKLVNEFLKHAFLGGLFTGLVMVIMELYYHKLAGILYGSSPFVFVYILIYYYFFKKISDGEKKSSLVNFTYYSILGGIVFIFMMAAFYYAYKLTHSLPYASLAFFISTFIFYYLLFKLEL